MNPPPTDEDNAKINLRVVCSAKEAALRTQGIPGVPQGSTTSFTSDDGKWLIKVPTEHFPNYKPGMMAFITVGIVQPFTEQLPPDVATPTSKLILPSGRPN